VDGALGTLALKHPTSTVENIIKVKLTIKSTLLAKVGAKTKADVKFEVVPCETLLTLLNAMV
jgi:hypothetical protein